MKKLFEEPSVEVVKLLTEVSMDVEVGGSQPGFEEDVEDW